MVWPVLFYFEYTLTLKIHIIFILVINKLSNVMLQIKVDLIYGQFKQRIYIVQ